MRKMMIGFAFFAIVAAAGYIRFHHAKAPLEVVYAGNRQVTLWTSTAQVREPVTTVSFGDRLDVLERFQDQVQVRTVKGAAGWVSQNELLSSELWEAARALRDRAASMPVEARGHTGALSNLHLEPGRETPRVRQLTKDVPVDLLLRQPVPVLAPNRPSGQGDSADADTSQPQKTQAPNAPARKEDWWLVQAHTPDQGAVAGWILGRRIALDVPAPLPDYASSAGMRIVAWFELNHVKDSGEEPKPQYLVVGAKGPQGQACDFSLMRVYTWAVKRDRYETAFVDSSVCGKLPIEIQHAASAESETLFSFEDLSNVTPEKRMYRMQQTIVRRVKQGTQAKPNKRARR